MQLKELRIRLMDYGPFSGSYAGEVEFSDEYHSTKVHLSSALSSKVLEVCAETLVEQAKVTANLMATHVIEQVQKTKQLPK